MRLSLRSNPARTFVLVPAAASVERAIRRRRPRLRWAPLMAAGYAQYRLVGAWRVRAAGGPPGMSQGFPDRLVTDGVYAYVRNPMYLGHLIFLAGLTLTTRSPVAAGYLAWALPWFDQRVRRDEQRLQDRFGAEYLCYRQRSSRWLPRLPPSGHE